MKNLICFLFLLINLTGYAQKKATKAPKDTTATRQWVREYLQQQLKPTQTNIPLVPVCKSGLDLLTITPLEKGLEFSFQAVDVVSIDWSIVQGGKVVASGNTGKLTSSKVHLSQSLVPGAYELQIKATNCQSDEAKGRRGFVVEASAAPSSSPTSKTDEGAALRLVPLRDPLLPSVELTGELEIRYIESRPDLYLNPTIKVKDGLVLLTDAGASLQSANYTLNGWSDPEDCSKLIDEPILPYRKYHLTKWGVENPNIQDWWKTKWGTPKIAGQRSEVFFVVVPKNESWNPVGQSVNPIGRPKGFSDLPPFRLTTRTYGFEYEFKDETEARQDELSISFNRKSRHLKLYANGLEDFIRSRGYDRGTRRPFENFTEQDCIDFANSLPIDLITAFDWEPGAATSWIVNYNAPNFSKNMGLVIRRLRERGALAYNWLDVPSKNPSNVTLDGRLLSVYGDYKQEPPNLYEEAYKRIGDIQKQDNPYAIVNTGFGYKVYDNELLAEDVTGRNKSPQRTYLKALDATELWSRLFPEKPLVYFTWAFMEFDGMIGFPPNHVVNIPEHDATARRTDNKPLYSPDWFQDNLTLGLLNAKYLFYWSPGPVGWNPANTSQYNDAYTSGFSVWTFEEGKAPLTDKFYIGKEAMAITAVQGAAYTFSQMEKAADGKRYSIAYKYQRALKDGKLPEAKLVNRIDDGSWYTKSLIYEQPFGLVIENRGERFLLFQDVWARPGRWTDFEFELEGRRYVGRTEGNRLFVAKL